MRVTFVEFAGRFLARVGNIRKTGGNFAAPPSDFPTYAGRFRKGHLKSLVKIRNISGTFESEGLFSPK